jgi:hypothetical protein
VLQGVTQAANLRIVHSCWHPDVSVERHQRSEELARSDESEVRVSFHDEERMVVPAIVPTLPKAGELGLHGRSASCVQAVDLDDEHVRPPKCTVMCAAHRI